MKFSILIPVYNVEKYLAACLESIDKQEYRDFEVVIVDDGSTDNSSKICEEYKSNHSNTVVIHKENGGLISARRSGIQNAQGDYCIFCDSDDLLEKNALTEIAKVIEKSKPDMVIYNAYEYDGTKKKPFFEHILKEGIVEDKTVIYDKLLLSYSLNPICLKAVKRSIMDVDRNYEKFYKCNFGEDLLQSVPLIQCAERIYYLDRCLYNYRVVSGMMHKYSPNYYRSYRAVNFDVREKLKNECILDFDDKIAFNLLVAAYGGTTQFKYVNWIDAKQLDEIRGDGAFQSAYKIVFNGKYKQNLGLKHKLVLWLLYRHFYLPIGLLLKIKR